MSTLRRSDDTGLSLYAILRDGSHQLVIAATGTLESYTSGNWATYAHAATEQGTTGYYYCTVSADLPVGSYWIEWKYQSGATPAVGNTVRATGSAYWDGANWLPDWAVKLAMSASPISGSLEEAATDIERQTDKLTFDGSNNVMASPQTAVSLIPAYDAAKTAAQPSDIPTDYQQRGVAVTLPAGGVVVADTSVSAVADAVAAKDFTINAGNTTGVFPASTLANTPRTGMVLSASSLARGPEASLNDADIPITVFRDGSPRLTARVYLNGAAITQADVLSITYSIYKLGTKTNERTEITGHTDVLLDKADVIFNAMQTDAQASKYNFCHQVPVSAYPAFTVAGRNYLVEYLITPVDGEAVIVRFRCDCI